MHDTHVRRRRVALGVLVAASLILLTAYFGEASNSPLHSVQRGIVDVFSPVQQGASKVLSPVRDLAGWVSDTFRAKSQNAQLRQQVALYRSEYDRAEGALVQNVHLRQELGLGNSANLQNYGPVSAEVSGYNPEVWYESITVAAGTGNGVRTGDPVVGNGGLVGIVSNVGSNWAKVSEFSAPGFAAGARVLSNGSASSGVLQPAAGDPTTLELNALPNNAPVNPGDQVVTSGFSDSTDPRIVSYYPPDIPIGTVSSTGYDDSTSTLQVQVTPAVNLRNLSVVQILTKRYSAAGSSRG